MLARSQAEPSEGLYSGRIPQTGGARHRFAAPRCLMLPIVRTDRFVADVDKQIQWYLEETGLDDLPAAELAQRFAAAVDETLVFLARTPGAGRPRAVRFSDLTGYRG